MARVVGLEPAGIVKELTPADHGVCCGSTRRRVIVSQVVIYSTRFCPFCVHAKALLQAQEGSVQGDCD